MRIFLSILVAAGLVAVQAGQKARAADPPITPPPRTGPGGAPPPPVLAPDPQPAPGTPPGPGGPGPQQPTPEGYPGPQPGGYLPDPGAGLPAPRVIRTEPPLRWFRKGYATLTGIYAFYSAGHLDFKNTGEGAGLETYTSGGIHGALYYIFHRMAHVGVFASYLGGRHRIKSEPFQDNSNDTVHEVAGGITGKFGYPLGRTMWFGGALDMGGVFLRFSALSSPAGGLYLYPKIVFDMVLFDAGVARLGVHATLGAVAVPYLSGRFSRGGVEIKHEGWLIRSVASLGFHIGF